MDEKKLELRLGPPGDDDYPPSTNSALSLCYSCVGVKRGFSATVEPKTEVFKQQPGFLKLQQAKADIGKTSGGAELSKQQCPPPSHASKSAATVQNSSQTRITSASLVGWPPIRSFRRNLATTSSSKPTLESHDESLEKASKLETKNKGLFVKINMDGIPIGRKVDLKAYDSYEKLSLAVDELFRGLLAAQRDPISAGNQRNLQKEQAITGLLDGSGEFTLVYEDDEGDQMLVGDVPWEMFVSMAKRLRVCLHCTWEQSTGRGQHQSVESHGMEAALLDFVSGLYIFCV